MQQRFDGSRAIVVSDLHIGLPYFRHQKFAHFLRSLEPDTPLILNGDVIDDPRRELEGEAAQVLDLLCSESYVRKVFWVRGNHDDGIQLGNPGEIRFCRHLEIGKRLLIVHGDDFDDIMPKSLWFIRMLKILHKLRIRLGAHPVHIAEFAKKWLPFLYRILTEEVKNNAVNCALENGFSAITCGHTHYAEDAFCEGVRYLNTGTWTEEPSYCLKLTEETLDLIQV
jgi:UDP-2,3-diacylglucosamine pyrophosphatase LpxH